MEASHPAIYAQRQIDKWGVAPPGGESYVALTQRVRDWYDGLTTDTVAVAHGGTMRALMVVTGVATPEEAAETPIGQGVVYVFESSRLSRYA
jgi:probable phosphoglycerate mutase